MRRRKLTFVLLAASGLVIALAGGVLAFTGELGGKLPAATGPDTQATSAGQAASRPVVAKGAVVPVQHAALSMAASGIVAEVAVKEGDRVPAGQLIVRLQNERQQAALAEADAAVASAQARLDTLKAGARSQEIASAQAALDAANARLARLQEAGRAQDLAAAQAALDAAQAAYKHLYEGPDPNTLTTAAADVASTEAAVRSAQAAYDQVKGQSDIAMRPESLQLQQATIAYEAAKAHYRELTDPPTADRVAQAAAQIKQAQADLDRLKKPATAAEIAEAEAGARQAQAQLDLLKAGTRDQEIAQAQAAVAQAAAARQQAAAGLADTELSAPFTGTLAALHVRQGEQAVAGTPVADLGDLSALQVETDDLSELDVVRVRPGLTVTLTFDAIPGLQLRGTVVRVQPLGEKKLGDMTYTAVVRLDQLDPRLLWNMTAVVNLP